ncbi:hypothetical protein [Burkholderia cenocepacia]|uniref:hypothetical protein n=1 Tax=Burkholderia cenocepacia TaxID=95486 RepID=UPI002B240D50|nr:hypothetical protein [Burkholderia cenocepacia]MEB2558781.1 hypothetical protein [Burkholderia cenocepacia]
MTSDQLELLELQRASVTGPATGEQLEQWAAEHDRVWDRKVRQRRILIAAVLIGLVGLAIVGVWRPAAPDVWSSRLVALAFVCLFSGVWLWRLWRGYLDERPRNPYRPSRVTRADLQERNANFPVALAYLDAIRHQRRPIVPHDIDVLAMIRRQQVLGRIRQKQQFNQGA